MATSSDMTAVVELQGNVDDLTKKMNVDAPAAVTQGMKKMHAAVTDASASIANASAEVGKSVGGSFWHGANLLAAAGATTFLMKVKDTFDKATAYAEQLSTLHIETGTSQKKLQELQYALAGVGVSSQQSLMQFAMFNDRISAAADMHNGRSIIERMGLDPRQMKTNDLVTNFGLVADKIKNLGSASERTYVAMLLFGRTGAQMLPALMKGADGLKLLGDAAVGAGAVFDDKALAQLTKYREALNQFNQSATVFFSEFALPFVDFMTRSIRYVQSLIAQFERLSQSMKLDVVFVALMAGIKLAEDGLTEISGLFVNIVGREAIKGILAFAGQLAGIADIALVLFVAFQSNFANIRGVLAQFGNDIQIVLKKVTQVFGDIQHYAAEKLGPAFTKLSAAVKPLVQDLMNVVNAILTNVGVWDTLGGVLKTVVDGITAVVSAVATIVDAIKNHLTLALTVLSYVIIRNVLPKLAAMAVALGADLLTSLFGLATTIYMTVIPALIALGRTAVSTFTGIAISEDVAAPPLIILQVAILLVASALAYVATHFKQVEDAGKSALLAITERLSKAWHWLSAFDKGLAQAISYIPGLSGLAGVFNSAGDAIGGAANKLDDFNNKLRANSKAAWWVGADSKLKPPGSSTSSHGDKHGNTSLDPLPGGHHGGNASADAIKKIKDELIPFNDAVANTKFKVDEVKAKIAQLGALDSPAKLATAQNLFTEEIYRTEQQEKAVSALHKAQEVALAKIVVLQKAASVAHNTKDLEKYNSEYQSMLNKVHASTLSLMGLQKNASDIELSSLQKKLDMHEKIYEIEQKHIELQLQADQSRIAQGIAVRNETTKDSHTRRVSNAQDDWLSAVKEEKIKRIELGIALAKEATIIDHSSVQYKEAANNVTIAETARTDATNKVTNAEIKLRQAEDETSTQVMTVRSGLASMAQTLSGPITSAFKMIQEGINPLVAIFLALFQQSKAFHDIQVILARVVAAVAQIFDALRPVIDFFLGVLVGIVNVFLTLYNVIAAVLNVFGAHIEKLKLVNTALKDLTNNTNQAVPLLQVTHDLPTMNEYNAGKWSDLIAKQNAQVNGQQQMAGILDQGFNQSLAKFGEIVGVLIAIKAVLMIISAHGILKDAFGGGGSGGGGIFGFLSKIFGAHSSSAQATATNALTKISNSSDTQNEYLHQATDSLSTMNDHMQTTATASAQTAGESTGQTTSATGLNVGIGKVVAGIGDAAGILAGFQQGGISGGITAGMSADSLALLLGASGGLATPIAIGVGLVSALFGGGGMFGPHYDPSTNPDMFQSTAPEFGQGWANLVGAGNGGVAPINVMGQAYNESGQLNQALGNQGELAFISAWIAKNPTQAAGLLTQQELQDFTGATTTTNLHQGVLTLNNGQSGMWNDLFNMATDAATKIGNVLTAAAMNLSNVLSGATNVDLATLFGNSTVVTNDGGYAVIPGGGGTTTSPGNPITVPTGPVQPITNPPVGGGGGGTGGGGSGGGVQPPGNHMHMHILINIANVNGLDPNLVREQLTPIFKDLGTQTQLAIRSRANVLGAMD